jgi:hypothetical protein
MLTLRHVCVLGLAAGFAFLANACGDVGSSCGNYFDTVSALEAQCDIVVDTSLRSGFVQVCEAVAKAPGASSFGSELDSCASGIKSGGCDSLVFNPPSCSIRGTQPDGAPCASSAQCSGGICNASNVVSTTSELQCGTCASYVAIGADCTTGGMCDPATSECIAGGKCTAYIPVGSACGTGIPSDCTPGFECNTSSVCAPVPTQGQACTVDCAIPFRCIGGVCGAAVQQGGACPKGDECASTLTCDPAAHTCQMPVVGQAGQACGFTDAGIVDCAEGLNCSAQSTCVAGKTAGMSCTVGMQECATYLLCINSICATPDYTVCM